MSTQLDFSIVTNNDDTVTIYVKDKDDAPVNLAAATLKWQMFDESGNIVITKSSSQLAKVVGPEGVKNGIGIAILAADTDPLAGGSYPHEAVSVSSGGAPVTITDNDPVLSYGVAFLRKQLTRQG